ncbi:uncharacterized protein BJ212DRAFT_599266 [Suillus subaureus]|uniref:Uncharacterized protein n=1 Tax=Suillus subaureus TaxID=48587 RepID=A0A9P7E2I3_9AGAM|nr:uncharacterized protein BJ212DRAFT_599266 [Suillus subaureus]KAG1809709.1 hypothetical protein BJ212DRAFT_599266 [Suillus subaureus]
MARMSSKKSRQRTSIHTCLPPESPHKAESEEAYSCLILSPMALALVLFLGLMEGVESAGIRIAVMGGECICSLLVGGVSWDLRRKQGRGKEKEGCASE